MKLVELQPFEAVWCLSFAFYLSLFLIWLLIKKENFVG